MSCWFGSVVIGAGVGIYPEVCNEVWGVRG